MNLKQAAALDRNDPYRKHRSRFALPKAVIYLDGNSLGAMPKAALARVKHATEIEWGRDLITSWTKHGWWELPRSTGNKIARLIGAAKDSVIVADTISVNLFKVLSAALTQRRTRKVILTDSGNFPSDAYVAQGLSAFMADGHQLKVVAPERLADEITEDVAVVMATEVDYRSARRHDMKAITTTAHAKGALMIWDLAHSAGALPIDLMGADADFAVGCTYKYLNGGPGAPAFAFVHPRLQNEVQSALVGWWGHANPFAFSPRFEPAQGIMRLQCGTQAMLNMAALDAALDEWKGVNMTRLAAKGRKLCEVFADSALSLCGEFGVTLHGPTDFSARGLHVCLAHDEAYAIMQALRARGVVGDFRAPNLMRFGFAPLYNSHADAIAAAQHLHDILSRRIWDRKAFRAKEL